MPVRPPQAMLTTFDPRSLHLIRWSAAGIWKLLSTTPCTWCSWGYAKTSTHHHLHTGFAKISLGQVLFLKGSVNFQKISGPNVAKKRNCYSASVAFSFGHPYTLIYSRLRYTSNPVVTNENKLSLEAHSVYNQCPHSPYISFWPLRIRVGFTRFTLANTGLDKGNHFPELGSIFKAAFLKSALWFFAKKALDIAEQYPHESWHQFINPSKYCGWKKSCAAW